MTHEQPKTLFDVLPQARSKDEPTVKPLAGQILRVYSALREGGEWKSIVELQEMTKDSPNSISAQIRNLRKPEFGSCNVVGRRRAGATDGSWEYCLIESGPEPA
ncbi:MAG TPA: hypothetical protein VJ180_11300 [Pyrinomonadaceae bacterium]|nr:hypothetical protein [Pyrinomonadaceae bacterium]